MYELHKRQFAYTGGKLLMFSTPSKMINDKKKVFDTNVKKDKKETKIVKKTKVFLNSRGKDGNYVSIYEEF